MTRPVLVLLGWLAATGVAIAVAYAGVSAVAGRVVHPLPPTMAAPERASSGPSTSAAGPGPTGPDVTTSPSTGPASPTARPDVGEVRSYALVGGTATLRFAPDRVTVVAAEPAQGFTVEVDGSGEDQVTVEFEAQHHRSRLRAEWNDGPRARVDEDGRDDADAD